jgi:hypothetical protein
VVVLERLEASWQHAQQRVGRALGRELGLVPADLGLRGAPHRPARRLRHELRAEADAEHRRAKLEQLAEEALLVAQPRVRLLLVHVHRAPEHHRGAKAVVGGRRPLVRQPLHELVPGRQRRFREHACGGVVVVDDGEYPH